MNSINSETKLFISASQKPGNFGSTIYNKLFSIYKINAVYVPRYATNATELARTIRFLQIAGCSVTSPLKTEIIASLDEQDELSTQLDSVNTVLNRQGKLIGHNTDYIGVQTVLSKLRPGRTLIYGSGSVTSTVIVALRTSGWTRINIVARDRVKALRVAESHSIEIARPSEIQNQTYDLIINCTPASSEGAKHEIYELLDRSKTAFDLVVSPHDTPWITAAKSKGLQTVSGIEMCKFQLELQFELYTGIKPEIDVIERIIDEYYRDALK